MRTTTERPLPNPRSVTSVAKPTSAVGTDRLAQITLPTLRGEQQEAVERWWPTRQGVITMPTGTGKTEVALALMAAASVSTLVVAPVRDLMYQ